MRQFINKYKSKMKKVAAASFIFFFLKGLAWIAITYLILK